MKIRVGDRVGMDGRAGGKAKEIEIKNSRSSKWITIAKYVTKNKTAVDSVLLMTALS